MRENSSSNEWQNRVYGGAEHFQLQFINLPTLIKKINFHGNGNPKHFGGK